MEAYVTETLIIYIVRILECRDSIAGMKQNISFSALSILALEPTQAFYVQCVQRSLSRPGVR